MLIFTNNDKNSNKEKNEMEISKGMNFAPSKQET